MTTSNPINILMIEDSTIFVNTVRAGLTQAPHLLDTFTFHFEHTLQKGLTYFTDHDVDVILVDLTLPDSEKHDTLNALKPIASQVPIIIISAIDEAEIAMQCFKFGIQDFLIKKNLTPSLVIRSMLHSIERKQLLDKLEKSSEKQFADLIEANEDSLIVVNQNKMICYVNKAAEKFLNGTRHILIGLPFTFPLDNDKISEITIVHPDQIKKHGEIKVSSIVWEGRPASLASIRDITQFKHVKDLKSSIKEREKFNKLKSKFLGTISHELRNPLTIVKGAVNNLKDGTEPLSETQNHLTSIAIRNLERIDNIIKNFLELSRLDASQVIVEKEKLDLPAIIAEAIQSLQTKIDNKNIKVTINKKSAVPVYGNKELILQVFVNLLSNGIKYTKNTLSISIKKKDEDLEIEIKDNGQGLSKDALNALFKKFVQINRDVSDASYKGTGLGLSICHEILSHHDGKIWAESEVGKGASFKFTLPIFEEKKALETLFSASIKAIENGTPMAWAYCFFPTNTHLPETKQATWRQVIREVCKATPHHMLFCESKNLGLISLKAIKKDVQKYRHAIKSECVEQGLPLPDIGIVETDPTINLEKLETLAKKDADIPIILLFGINQEAIDLLAISFTKAKCRVFQTNSKTEALKKMAALAPSIAVIANAESADAQTLISDIQTLAIKPYIATICLSNQTPDTSRIPEKTVYIPTNATATDVLKAAKELNIYKI